MIIIIAASYTDALPTALYIKSLVKIFCFKSLYYIFGGDGVDEEGYGRFSTGTLD